MATLPMKFGHRYSFSAFPILLVLMLAGYSQCPAQAYDPDLSIDLPAFQGKALQAKEEIWVVDFWATWCGPCVMAIPHMKELQQKYSSKPVRFVSVSWDRNEQQWMAGLMRFEMPWNHLIVPKGQEAWLEKKFPHKGIPTAFVIDRTGKAKKVSDVYLLDKAIQKAIKIQP